MFRKRWFELEPGYILSFYNGSEKLGSIGISDMTQVNRVSDLEFKSVQFPSLLLSHIIFPSLIISYIFLVSYSYSLI